MSTPERSEPRNEFGRTAFILGVIGLVLAFVQLKEFPLTGLMAVIAGVAAFLFGLANYGRLTAGEATNRSTTGWGQLIGVLAVVLGVVGIVDEQAGEPSNRAPQSCLEAVDAAEAVARSTSRVEVYELYHPAKPPPDQLIDARKRDAGAFREAKRACRADQ
jgi:hypothetical protein